MIHNQFIRYDMEGELIQLSYPGTRQYVKVLSSKDIAWHIEDPVFFFEDETDLIERVEENPENAEYRIRYHAQLQPLDLPYLKNLLNIQEPLSLWRTCKFFLDILTSLKHFHDLDAPQGVIHPNRLGYLDKSFVILPTFTGPLPPLSQWNSDRFHNYQWLYFMAPEVVRSRCIDQSILQSGDIYSLGRLFHLLISEEVPELDIQDPLNFVEGLVENFYFPEITSCHSSLDILVPIIKQMCAWHPANRPDCAQVIVSIQQIITQADPFTDIQNDINYKNLNPAKQKTEALKKSRKNKVFDFDFGKLSYLQAELELIQPLPNLGIAIGHYNRALGSNLNRIEIHEKIGQTYEKFHKHSQNLDMAMSHYLQAINILGEWQAGILDKMLGIFNQIKDPNLILKYLLKIPPQQRPPELFVLLIRSYIKLEEFDVAWKIVIKYYMEWYPKHGFHSGVFQISIEVAAWIKEENRMSLKNNIVKEVGSAYDLIRAIIWKSIGDDFRGNRFLEKARNNLQ